MFHLTDKEASILLCSVVKHAGSSDSTKEVLGKTLACGFFFFFFFGGGGQIRQNAEQKQKLVRFQLTVLCTLI